MLVFAEMSEEIRGCLMEVESCFQLLMPFDLGPSLGPVSSTVASGASDEGAPYRAGVPNLEDEEQPCCSKALPASAWRPAAIDGEGLSQAASGSPSEEDEDSDQEEFVRCHGLGSHKYTLDVELSSGNGAAGRCSVPVPRSLHWSGLPRLPSAPGLLGHF